MEPRKIILALVATLTAGLALSFVLSARQKIREREERSREVPGPNPLYEDLKRIGAADGVNVDFAKQAVLQRAYFFSISDNYVLRQPPRSFDVLIVGDSSVAWGVIPEVIEQISGLRVGIFAAEGLALNTTTARVIRNLAVRYLPPDGLLVTAFGDWTQEQPADSKVLVAPEWMAKAASLDPAGFDSFVERMRSGGDEASETTPLAYLSFSRWRGIHAHVKRYIADTWFLSLNRTDLYADYIEKYTNPAWHWVKRINLLVLKGYLRWNNRSVTVLTRDLAEMDELKRFRQMEKFNIFNIRSRRSESPPDTSYRNADVAAVSALIREIPRRKAVLVHFHSNDATYVKLRSIYHVYYRGNASLIDLGREHPAGEGFPMDAKGHMVNTGGMYESVYLGRYLKRHYASLGR